MRTVFAPLFVIFALLMVAPSPADATQNDDRVETVAFQDGEIVLLHSAAGNGVMVIFAPGEQVIGFDILDPDAISIDSWTNPGSLFLKTHGVPIEPQVTIRTQLRSYVFSIKVGQPDTATSVVRFSYESEPALEAPEATFEVSRPQYRITGEKTLRPERISDDGVHTYLIWNAEQALPAVFAINASGDEEIVDGYMRNGVFTIDRVHARLVFRIDRKSAKAERLTR